MTHFIHVISLLPLIGVQGNNNHGSAVLDIYKSYTGYAGQLLVLAYVTSDYKKTMLVVLSVLGCCIIIPVLV